MDNRQDKEIATLQNLEDAGCEKNLIAEYLQYGEKGMIQQQLCLLTKHRKVLLERMHEEQRRIDCLDYLICKIKDDKGRNSNEQTSINHIGKLS